jgi:diguanylate cyclase (GGDEF)-like protein
MPPRTQKRGVSLELKTAVMVAAVMVFFGLAYWIWSNHDSLLQLAVGVCAVFALVIVVFDIWVYRPLNGLIRRSRQGIGGKYASTDPHYRDEIEELGSLVDTLISVYTSAEDKETAAEIVRDDLMRLRVFNRQLVEVGQFAQSINAALPYRETAERVLIGAKQFLHADFVALLLLDPDSRAYRIEGSLGVRSRDTDAECCRYTSDCPVRGAIGARELLRTQDHACTLFPQTMRSQVTVPFPVENVGDMALLAATTNGANFDRVGDNVLETLRGHIESALANARKYDAIRRQVVTDHLTHLYNRRYFMNRATEELSRSLENQVPVSVVMVDIDHFKEFNDSFGHATGDRVLQAVATALQEALRTTDICARHGGEEFVMLLPATPGENATFVADRVRRKLAGIRYTGLGLPATANITISAGVATCPRDATSVDSLLELADQAMYRAKAEGRNRVCQYAIEAEEVVSR